jgi:quercetin dioxygenase-like cupin family protein
MKYKNVAECEDIIKPDYSKKVIFNPSDFSQIGHQLQTVTIPPQTKQRKHYHTKQTEVFYILSGESEVGVNGQVYNAVSGDAFICSPNEIHYYHNRTDAPFTLLVFKIDFPQDDDTVWLE